MNAGPLTLTPGLAAGVQQGSVPNAALISSNAADLYYRYYPSGNLNNANAASASASASASVAPTSLNPNSPPQNATPNSATSSVLNSGLLAIHSAPTLPAFSGYQSYPSANLVALYSSVPAGASSYCANLATPAYGAGPGDYSLAYLGASATASGTYCATGSAVETRADIATAVDAYTQSNLRSSNGHSIGINNNSGDKSK